LVGLSNILLLSQKSKANQRGEKPQLLWLKSSFPFGTNPKVADWLFTLFAYAKIWLMLMLMLKYYERKHCSTVEK
jgi:hypothetical protein